MADYAVGKEEQMGLMPTSLSFAEAGTVPIVGGTSLQCLLCLQPRPGSPADAGGDGDGDGNPCPPATSDTPLDNMTVVITSGSGGTGYLGVQIAKALGAGRIITAATGDRAIRWMHALGADTVVDYMARDVFDALDDDSVDAVFDNYGGKGTADKAMSKLRAGGIYLLLPGGGGGTISPHPKPGVRQISFGDVDDHDHATMDRLAAMFDAGKIAINRGPVSGIQRAYTWRDGWKAYDDVAGGKVLGKIAIGPVV